LAYTNLGQAYRNIWEEGGITYISNNAKYVTDHWERWDNLKGAWLIKLDEGVKTEYYCAAGSGTITWNSDPITITGTAIINAKFEFTDYIAIASDVLENTGGTAGNIGTEIYTKVYEFQIPYGFNGYENSEFRLKFGLKSLRDDEYGYVYGRIYKNGVAIGTGQGTASTSYVYFEEDITGWRGGDLTQLYIKSQYDFCTAYYTTMEVKYDKISTTHNMGDSTVW